MAWSISNIRTSKGQRNSLKNTKARFDPEKSALARMQEVEKLAGLLDRLPANPTPEAAGQDSRVQYTVSLEDGKKATACGQANEREMLIWLFNNTYHVLNQKAKQKTAFPLSRRSAPCS